MNAILSFFNQSIRKKALIFSLSAIICLSGAAAVWSAHTDLSGEWKLNEQKSELGQYGSRMAAKTIKIAGQEDAVTIERMISNQNGEDITATDKLTFDGKESESTLFGNTKKKSTAKWSDDGQTLNISSIILFDRNGESMEIKVTEAVKLLDNGQSLSIESASSSTWGTNTMKLVYDKAK